MRNIFFEQDEEDVALLFISNSKVQKYLQPTVDLSARSSFTEGLIHGIGNSDYINTSNQYDNITYANKIVEIMENNLLGDFLTLNEEQR